MSNNINVWKRACPECGKEIGYSRKDTLVRAEKGNRKCRNCCFDNVIPWNRGWSKETNVRIQQYAVKISNTTTGKKIPLEIVNKRNKTRQSKGWHTQSAKDNISRGNMGKRRSELTKSRQRKSAMIRMMRDNYIGGPNFNVEACKFIDKLNEYMGLNLQHAMNGGEVELYGYYPDGYDKEKNIIFEYDEPNHHSPAHVQQDILRQTNLLRKINPILFIRYNEKEKRLYDVKTNQEIPIVI